MVPDNLACNPRNNHPQIVSCEDNSISDNFYKNAVIDLKNNDITVEYILNLFRNKYSFYDLQ